MKGAAWRGHGGLSAADHLGAGALAAARRARLCIYGVALAFGAFAAFLAFAPSLPAPPPSSPSAAWLDGVLASASPYRAQVSGFFSSLFPANSSHSSFPGPPGPGVVAARRSGPGGGGLAAGGGPAGTNGSTAVRPHGQSGGGNSGGVRGGNSESSNATAAVGARTNGSSPGQQSGGGGAVPGGNSGGVRTDNPATGNAAASAARSDAPPRDHAGGGEAASNSSGIAAAAPNNSSGIAAAEAKVNASSAEATASNGTAIPSVNQTRSAVSAMLHGNVAAPHRRGHPGKNHTAQDSAAHHDQQQSVNRAAVASGGSNSTKTMHKEATAPSQGSRLPMLVVRRRSFTRSRRWADATCSTAIGSGTTRTLSTRRDRALTSTSPSTATSTAAPIRPTRDSGGSPAGAASRG
uniref:Uncharacterized protein n=1 Tax=Aegilops tauschii subsp. strangulata TaxID=200361 RepID=A0A453PNR9_AEGTS